MRNANLIPIKMSDPPKFMMIQFNSLFLSGVDGSTYIFDPCPCQKIGNKFLQAVAMGCDKKIKKCSFSMILKNFHDYVDLNCLLKYSHVLMPCAHGIRKCLRCFIAHILQLVFLQTIILFTYLCAILLNPHTIDLEKKLWCDFVIERLHHVFHVTPSVLKGYFIIL